MFSSDKGKQKKRRSLEANASHSSTEKPVHQQGTGSRKGRSHPNLLNFPLYPPSRVQNASNETGRDKPEDVTRSGGDSTSAVAVVAGKDAESEYQNMSYTDKLSIAIQMVPNLLAGDANQALEQLLHNPAFAAELVAAGVIFAGLQATPLGPLIDAYMVTTLGVEVASKLGGFLYKSYTAHNENDLKAAAVDLKGFIEVAGLAGATKLLGMAGRALKKLSGEATAVEGQTVHHGELRDVSDKEAAKIWGAGPGKTPHSKARKANKAQSSKQRAANTTSQVDQPLEPVNPQKSTHGHGHADHGHQTTATQHGDRIRTGYAPSGRYAPSSKSSHFNSAKAEAEALGKARTQLKKDIQSGGVSKYDPTSTNGEPNRHVVVVNTTRVDGFGSKIMKQKDSNGNVIRDASGQPLTTTDPNPLTSAKVIFEYVPSKNVWKPVTYFPQ
jgi:hypothetical protein